MRAASPTCLLLTAALILACGDDTMASSTGSGSGGRAAHASGGGDQGGGSSGRGGSSGVISGVGGSASSGGGSTASAGSGGSGGDPTPFVPEPIPGLEDEPAEPCPELDDEPYAYQFLDGFCAGKILPTDTDRDRACPIVDESSAIPLTGGGTAVYVPSDGPFDVDGTALLGIVPDELDVTVIEIRRVEGRPHYRYLSNGSHEVAYQPWSSTKFLAAANAAARLRLASGGAVGLTASVDGLPLGDLVSSMHTYDGATYSSNSLGRYFHDIGGRQRANDMIHGAWLGRPGEETFGGNYGAPSPGLPYTFVEEGGADVAIAPDGTSGPANRLSTLTQAEALKRLVLHREEPGQALPDITWEDLRVLFYGAETSEIYGPFGGMSADKAIYLQAGHDMDYLERRSHGRWRIFSKLGNGSEGQFVNVAYGCFPVLDDRDQPVPGWGRELVIAAHLPAGEGTWRTRDRTLARAFRAILTRVIDGRL